MPAILTATFTRPPISGGDNNNYDTYVMQQIRRGSIGSNNIDVSNSGGSLNVGLGFAGINDGVTEGAIQVTVPGSQTLAGSTAGVWHALEFSVSGTAATFYLTALAGETDESFMSLAMKGYYDAAKGGYYRIASRRVLAFVFIRAGTVLGRIVNTENGVKGFKGITIIDYIDKVGAYSQKYLTKYEQEIGVWNMDSTISVSVTFPFTIANVRSLSGIIFGDLANTRFLINTFQDSADANLIAGGFFGAGTGNISIIRRTGGYFDSVNFDDGTMNRGIVVIEYET
jgi:hypothetical protein